MGAWHGAVTDSQLVEEDVHCSGVAFDCSEKLLYLVGREEGPTKSILSRRVKHPLFSNRFEVAQRLVVHVEVVSHGGFAETSAMSTRGGR